MKLLRTIGSFTGSSLVRKFVVAVLAVNATLGILLGWELLDREAAQNTQTRVMRARGMANILADSAAPLILKDNRSDLARLAATAQRVDGVEYVRILNDSGGLIAGAGTDAPTPISRERDVQHMAQAPQLRITDRYVDAAVPVTRGSNVVGRVEVRVAKSGSGAGSVGLAILAVTYGLAFVLLTGLVALLTARSLTRRLAAIVDATERFRLGDREVSLMPSGTDEVTRLSRCLDEMFKDVAESERALADVVRIAKVGSWRYSSEHHQLEISESARKVFGLEGAGEPSLPWLLKSLGRANAARLAVLLSERNPDTILTLDFAFFTPGGDGRRCWVEARFEPGREGEVGSLAGICQDVTERENAAQQLRQAQKMEAVGQLTGGLAHDFNNLLAIIIGNLDLLSESSDFGIEDKVCIEEALDAALRGSELTKHLLAFSRRQPLVPKIIDLNSLIRRMAPLWSRTLGEAVEVRMELDEAAWLTHADPAQVGSAILNLIINARDAMPSGGILNIDTQTARISDDVSADADGIEPGEYSVIAVSDTGVGMSPTVVSQAFEPFFTTKAVGHGSGLGLSMVYGFAQQSGGAVRIYSEEGQGTTVRLYLPRAGAGIAPSDGNPLNPQSLGRVTDKRVLIVEDNESVLRVAERQFRELGFEVMSASNGSAALETLNHAKIDLLFTDVVMPGGINGYELAGQATAADPSLKVLLTSGFARPSQNAQSVDSTSAPILTKPYRKEDLASSVFGVLGLTQ